MSDELTNQDLIDIVEDSLPDERRDLVRRVLKENPDLARRLKALHDDRAGLQSLARQDAQGGVPGGLVASAIGAAKGGSGGLRLVHADDVPRDDRSRHHRPALTRSRRPVAIAAAAVLLLLGSVSVVIIRTTSPEAVRDSRLAEVERLENIKLAPGSEPPEVAINAGNAGLEEDAARARAFERALDNKLAGTSGASGDDGGKLDLGEMDLGLDLLLAEGVNAEEVLDASGFTVDELGLALLEGRVVVTARGNSGDRILSAASGLDGAASGAGGAIAVRGLNGTLIGDQRVDLAKPAAERAPGEAAPLSDGGEVEVSFSAVSDRSIGGAYAEFETLLAVIAQVSGEVVIEIDSDAPARRIAAPLDAGTAIWWEQDTTAWVVPMPASFRLVVEPPVEGPSTGP